MACNFESYIDIGDITSIGVVQDVFLVGYASYMLKRIMPTEKPRFLITLDQELLERINDFRFENRIESKSEAIRRLIEESLDRHENAAKKGKK